MDGQDLTVEGQFYLIIEASYTPAEQRDYDEFVDLMGWYDEDEEEDSEGQ